MGHPSTLLPQVEIRVSHHKPNTISFQARAQVDASIGVGTSTADWIDVGEIKMCAQDEPNAWWRAFI